MRLQDPGCLAALFGLGRRRETPNRYPYRARPYFFTDAEASFYQFLKQMVGENGVVFPHVALRDLVSVRGVEQTHYYRYFHQIDKRQIDFLIADARTLKARIAIELEDLSQQGEQHPRRDEFVERVLEAAGIPFARVSVQPTYDAKELTEAFRLAIQKNAQPTN